MRACPARGERAIYRSNRPPKTWIKLRGGRRMDSQQTRPSKGRWYILFLICLMYLITYLDRVNISTAAPVIAKEFGFDKITMGVIFSAFVWAYAMFQVPGGWLGDRFGARNVLTIIVSYWSVMTAATAAATGAVSFVIIRFLFGIRARSAASSKGSPTVRAASAQPLRRRLSF